MKRYALVHLLIIAGPLALSFDRKVHFVSHWPAVGIAILVVGGLYIVWDGVFAARGYWGFNTRHVGDLRLFHLPLEEILFFVTVPYACLFILEVVRSYWEPFRLGFAPQLFLIPAGLMAVLAVPVRHKPYTFVNLLAGALFLTLTVLVRPTMLVNGHFWIYMGLAYIPFLIFNGILTGVPVVVYSPQAILGPRVITIPIEDFLYNFSFLGASALVYLTADGLLTP